LPDADHVALVIVPLFPFPDASVTVVPDPSSNPYAATNPDDAARASCTPCSTRSPPAPAAVAVNTAAAARMIERRDVRFAMPKSPLVA
jgi:hypothetical protein